MPVSLECHNCGRQWKYTGSKPIGVHTNCPNRDCRYKVEIQPRDGS